MRRYLVTGASGWLEGELERRLRNFPGKYEIDRLSVRGDSWLDSDWTGYDGVFHFASVVYGNNPEKVNSALAMRVAAKCATDNVPWLLVMSSFSVYGAETRLNVVVDYSTNALPVSPYGKSKLAAEEAARSALEGTKVRLAIVRAPLIYGPGQKNGSFPALMALARKIPLFPETANARSMIFSQNLCELCRILADESSEGLFLPQDDEYHNTADLVKRLAKCQGRKVRFVRGTSGLANRLAGLSPKLGKLFGSARYEMASSDCGRPYRIASIQQALVETVEGAR